MFEPKSIKSTIVALNFIFPNGADFFEKLREKGLIEKYNLKPEPQSFTVRSNIEPPKEVLNGISSFIPVSLVSADTLIKVIYVQQEYKLIVEKENFDNKCFDDYSKLINDLLDFKLSDISAIGFNFDAVYNLGNLKLNLLNTSIVDKIPDFTKNSTFEFVLPIDYKERGMIATYRIKKISGGDNTGEDRLYNIKVNYHYALANMTTTEKIQKINEIISINLYNEFLEKSNKFLELNDGGYEA